MRVFMKSGTVKWFNETRGFGFISPQDGSKDVFVHYTCIQGEGFKTLVENQVVEYDANVGPKGPQATVCIPQ
jgi:cold shock protein